MTSPSVTVATLIYRSPEWLEFVLGQLRAAVAGCLYDVLVVGNDTNSRIGEWLRKETWLEDGNELDGRRSWKGFAFRYVDYRNPDPHAYYMGRIYKAWNRAILYAGTEHVALINSDMSFADGWLDELVTMREEFPCIPTSLLIESGRVPSGLPEQVRDFGRHWSTFDRAAFLARAEQIRAGTGRRMAGGLFMPVLFRRSEFLAAGGYEIQVPNHALASDAKLFMKLENEMKLPHVTAVRSVVYHIQRGEMEDDIA